MDEGWRLDVDCHVAGLLAMTGGWFLVALRVNAEVDGDSVEVPPLRFASVGKWVALWVNGEVIGDCYPFDYAQGRLLAMTDGCR